MKHPTTKKRGAKRVLDYDQIREKLVAGERIVDIAHDVGCSSFHVWRLKRMWGLIPDRWAEVPIWY